VSAYRRRYSFRRGGPTRQVDWEQQPRARGRVNLPRLASARRALEGPTLSDNCAVSVSASSAFFGVGTDLAFPKTIELHKRVLHPRAELPPLEARLPLLHEGGAALAIIGAVEAGAAGARDCPKVAVRRVF